jgi:hypothetical protein
VQYIYILTYFESTFIFELAMKVIENNRVLLIRKIQIIKYILYFKKSLSIIQISVGQNFENFENFEKIPIEINFRKMVTNFFFEIYFFEISFFEKKIFEIEFFRKNIRKFRKILNFHEN